MGIGGSPGGQHLGVLKCVAKVAIKEDKVNVSFHGENGSAAVFTLEKEAADYFVVGESYLFTATHP